MKEYRVFPYIFRNSTLMSNMSISALATIVLIRTLSVVPSPWRHTATAFILVEYLPLSFACIQNLPSSICTSVLQRRLACSECISLEGNNKDSLFCRFGTHLSNVSTKEGCRDAPTARKTSSREPDISLLMLSSMSLPEIFRYSSNTKGRRRYIGPYLHFKRLIQWRHSLKRSHFDHVNMWQIPRRRCFRFLTHRTVRNLTSSVPHRASPASKISWSHTQIKRSKGSKVRRVKLTLASTTAWASSTVSLSSRPACKTAEGKCPTCKFWLLHKFGEQLSFCFLTSTRTHREQRDQNSAEHSRSVPTYIAFQGFFIVCHKTTKCDAQK